MSEPEQKTKIPNPSATASVSVPSVTTSTSATGKSGTNVSVNGALGPVRKLEFDAGKDKDKTKIDKEDGKALPSLSLFLERVLPFFLIFFCRRVGC